MRYPKSIEIKRMDQIPQTLQEVFFSVEKSDRIKKIATEGALNNDQLKKLQQSINTILLCLQPLSTLRSLIMSDVGLPYEQATKISATVEKELLAPVMNDLKKFENNPKMYGLNEETPRPVVEKIPQNEATAPTSDPNHLIPTHDMLVKTDGPHTHNQTTSTPTNLPGASIVDQKLRGLVRAEREETHIRDDVEKRRKIVYKDADPYREPIE